MTLGGGHIPDHMHSMMSHHVAPSTTMYSPGHLGGTEFGKQSDAKDYSMGSQDHMDMGLQINLGDDLVNHSDAVGAFTGYYN